jgi:gluconokinase
MLSTDLRSSFHARTFPFPSSRSRFTMSDPVSDAQEAEHIWLVTGPAGCGKTTVAQYLAKELSLPYVEGDDVRR